MLRNIKKFAVVAIMAMTAVSVMADTWPSKPVKIIVPFGAGGTSDIAARLVADRLSKRFGQSVIIENKAGVSGLLGTELAAKSPADGYTLLLTSIGPLVFAPSSPKKLGYDPLQDFIHIGMIGTTPLVLVVNNDFLPKKLDEVVALAKSKPNALNFGSSGPASPSHLMLERFKGRFDLDISHIPFKNGSPATLNEIIAGRVDGAWDTLPAMLTMIKANRVRPLAVAASQRNPLVPEIPTVSELGYPDLVSTSWFGLAAPAGTSKEIINRINTEMNSILRTSEMKAKLNELTFATVSYSPDEMHKFISGEIEKWKPVVVSSKITF